MAAPCSEVARHSRQHGCAVGTLTARPGDIPEHWRKRALNCSTYWAMQRAPEGERHPRRRRRLTACAPPPWPAAPHSRQTAAQPAVRPVMRRAVHSAHLLRRRRSSVPGRADGVQLTTTTAGSTGNTAKKLRSRNPTTRPTVELPNDSFHFA